MLARLLQIITLGALSMAATWIAWMIHLDEPTWAAAGFLAVSGGYAVVLAIELALQRWISRNDPAPPVRPAQLLSAWWAEARAVPVVFCWWQAFRSWLVPDHLPRLPTAAASTAGVDRPGQRGVVFVHGFVCNRGIWNPWMTRLRERDIPFVAVNLEPVFGSIDDYPPAIEAAVRRVTDATGLAPVIVAHSMGGLASRAWLQRFGSAEQRVSRIITLGTPHHGTFLAKFGHTVNGRQMRPGSDWLREMSTRESAGDYRRFTCFYSHCDNISFPVSTATLPGADNRHLVACAHVQMAQRDEVFDDLLKWVRA